MKKSFIERVFPQTGRDPLLPQHDPRQHISLRDSSPLQTSRSRSSSALSNDRLSSAALVPRSVSLAASIIRHDDPYLPIDRAAQSLQRTIQSLLDAQSEGLVAGFSGVAHEEQSSTGSLTPTPSAVSAPRSLTRPKTLPIRQPLRKKVTLRAARKGLSRAMQDFALLKGEEVKSLDYQFMEREGALKSVDTFEDKQRRLQNHINALRETDNAASARSIRSQAQALDVEIKTLEDKLSEMKSTHRNLLDHASQLESSVDSELSSYKSSLDILNKEIEQFLRKPPMTSRILASRNSDLDMHSLDPKRRTLEMAKEQWQAEQTSLKLQMEETEHEKHALAEGNNVWREVVEQLTALEKNILNQTKSLSQSQIGRPQNFSTNSNHSPTPEHDMHETLSQLSSTITFLESQLSLAESEHWNILICAIGAELEALREGKQLLEETLGIMPPPAEKGREKATLDAAAASDDDDGPDEELIRYGGDVNGGVLHSPDSASSNKSLEDTLDAFSRGPKKLVKEDAREKATEPRGSTTQQHEQPPRGSIMLGPSTDSRSESEDDDPGPDFLLSHT